MHGLCAYIMPYLWPLQMPIKSVRFMVHHNSAGLHAPLLPAVSLPLRGLSEGQQPAFAPVNMSAFRGMSGSRKRQPSVDNLKALAGS